MNKYTKSSRYDTRNYDLVITIDGKAQEMRSIRLMQKAGAYTEYQFSNYKLGATIDEKIFK